MPTGKKRLFLCLPALGILWACSGSETAPRQAPPHDSPVCNDALWPMHAVDSRFRGANGLSPGDVNQDGLDDYVTNYEFDQRLVVSFHPGAGEDPGQPWPTVTAWVPKPLANGNGINPEHSSLADFDGDGSLDVAAAQGWSGLPFWEGSQPGIRLIWGPAPDRALDPEAWTDAGRIPATIDRGHLIYVVPFDVNGDGAVDLISGGRVHGGNGRKGGVIWIEAPADPGLRRDLARWTVHDIDPEQFSAHGLLLADIDQDGDLDLALANADFDTPEEEEQVLWYENPGTGAAAQKDRWPLHVIYQGGEFDGKPQLAPADLDRDGLQDLVVQLARDIYFFRKTGLEPVSWERIVIPKDPATQWPGRPIRVADLNGDGRLDLLGMLMHQDGDLPGDRFSVFWMEYQGNKPAENNWITHPIKFGSGRTMLLPIFGEKWDQANLVDVDGDGDLDVVANCEEWWEADLEFRFFFDPKASARSVAVVWFENRLHEPRYEFREQGGLCVMEAEHFTDLHDGTWVERSLFAGHGGQGCVQDHLALRSVIREWQESRGLEYTFHVQGGAYNLWARRWAPARWGFLLAGLGGSNSDSAWFGIDGEPLAGGIFDDGAADFDTWTWVKAPVPLELAPGSHVLHLRVREGGYAVDRILLAADPGFMPAGTGPHETR